MVRNWLILPSFSQDPAQNFVRISVSRHCKIMPILIRILIGKCKDLAKIFAGYCLLYSALLISSENLEWSFRIMNLKDPDKFHWEFFSRFVQVLAQIFSWIEITGSYQDSVSILFTILTRLIERIWSRFYQVLAKIYFGSCYEDLVKSYSYIREGSYQE